MTSILWVQTKTETGSDDIVRDCKKGGQADFDELLLYKKESQWNQLAVEPYKIKKNRRRVPCARTFRRCGLLEF